MTINVLDGIRTFVYIVLFYVRLRCASVFSRHKAPTDNENKSIIAVSFVTFMESNVPRANYAHFARYS